MWVRIVSIVRKGIMKTFKVGNKMLKDLESRLHGDVIVDLSPSKDGFKLQAFV